MDRIGELYNGQIQAEETIEVARRRIHWICSQAVGETVLDIGCSQGIAALLLAREGLRVTGLDPHPDAIRYAQEAGARELASVAARLRWVQGDLSHQDLKGQQFDTLIMGEVIEHQALPERFLLQALQFAREGTRVVLTTPFGLHPHPDHKVELFPRHLALFAAHGDLVVEFLDVVDGYMRLVARMQRQHDAGQRTPTAESLLALTEGGTLSSQSALYDRLRERADVVKKLQASQKVYQRKLAALTEEVDGTAKASAQLQSKLAAMQQARDAAKTEAQANASALTARQTQLDELNASLQDTANLLNKLEVELAGKSRMLDTLKSELSSKAHEVGTLQGELSVEKQASQSLRDAFDAQAEALESRKAGDAQRALIASLARSCLMHESREAKSRLRTATVATEFVGLGLLLSSGQAEAVRRSFSFQLGNALLGSARSWRNLARLPSTLARAYRDASRHRASTAAPAGTAASGGYDDLLAIHATQGLRAFFAGVGQLSDAASRGQAFARLAEQLRSTQPEVAEYAARQAYVCDPTPSRAKWLAFRLHDAGHVSEPLRLLGALPPELPVAEPERRRWAEIGEQWLATQLPQTFDAPDKDLYSDSAEVIVAVTDQRSAGQAGMDLLRELNAAGLKPRCEFATVDFSPEKCWPMNQATGGEGAGQAKARVRRPTEKGLDRLLVSAIVRAGRSLERDVRTRRAGAVAVRLDSPLALPALWVAQRLGIALICLVEDVIGRQTSSRELTQRQLARDLFVLDRASLVVAKTPALAWQCEAHLASRQVPVIVAAPSPSQRDNRAASGLAGEAVGARPLRLGWIADTSSHGGGAQLLHAVAQAKKRDIDISLTIAGSAAQCKSLKADTEKLKLHDVNLVVAATEQGIRKALDDCHAVVFPALARGLDDLVAADAFDGFVRSGRWVITSDLPGPLAAGRQCANVITVQAGDRRQLSDAIVALHSGKQPSSRPAGVNGSRADASLTELAGVLRKALSAKADFPMVPVAESSIEPDDDSAHWRSVFEQEGVAGVIAQLTPRGADQAAREASELVRVAKILHQAGISEAEFPMVQAAAEHHRSAFTLQALFWGAQRAKQFVVSCTAVRQLEDLFGPHPDARQVALLERFRRSPVTMLDVVAEIDASSVRAIESIPGRICYVLHNTLPYSSGGYATRSHGISTGLKACGWDVVVLSRPGYPADLKPEGEMSDIPAADVIDDISYVRTLTPRRRAGLSSRAYVLEAAAALEQRIREHRPSLVMAASNYITALPALIAARRTGVPFVYDVRGFWEITRLSREPEYEANPNYETQRVLEALVAKEADHVFTLTEPMREELVARDVAREKIDLFPNSCDPTKFHASLRDHALAATLGIPDGVPVIGYIGTFVDYEGLEDLAEACAQLKRDGIEFRLLLVGNENTSGTERGPIMQSIHSSADSAGFADWLIMPGRVPHEQVEAYYSLIDIAPFPRKPWPVCEMVSPMKPLEAMAMEKAVLVSSVRALREMVRDGQTGMVFEKGNTRSLAGALKSLIVDHELRASLGKAGKSWVEQERSWKKTTERFTRRCNDLFGFGIGQA